MSGEGLVSIIVPVYNSAEYIGECVESVLAQTYANYELLLIDDGSPDDSRALCEELCTRDERIRLIVQEHRGVSAARNAGMREAKGEYLFFLDSDDAIHPLLLEELVRQMICADAELALCDFIKMDSRRVRKLAENTSENDDIPQWKIIEKSETEKWFHIVRPKALHCIGGSLFLRDVIGSVRFDESLRNGEDTLFIYYLICKRIRIAYTNKRWYYYRIHSGNASGSVTHPGKDLSWESGRIIRDAELAKSNLDYALPWECMAVCQMARNFYRMRRQRNTEGCERIREQAAAEMRHPLFSKTDRTTKILFYCCFFCYPVYPLLEKLVSMIWEARNAGRR